MRLQLSKLQENDKETKLLRGAAGLPESWEDVEGVHQYQRRLYILEIIRSEVINCHHDDPLVGYFGIDKTRELVGRKYYWPSLQKNIENYVRGCAICLASKAVCYKPYRDLLSMPVLTHWWRDLSMDFMTGLAVSANWKSNSYDSILVIVNRLTKMV